MSQDLEPSAQDYTRFHGLTKDYLEQGPLLGVADIHVCIGQPEEDEDIAQVIGNNGMLDTERPYATDETFSFLASVIKPPRVGNVELDEDLTLGKRRYRDLKQELPMLHTDHEMDMQKFKRRVTLDVEHEHLPLESINEEADEGITWPSRYYDQLRELWQDIRTEKPSLSGEAFWLLKDCVEPPSNRQFCDSVEDDNSEPSYKKSRWPDPVTPPLLPMSPETSPYVPSSETGHLNLWSDATSILQGEIEEAEKSIFKDDAIVPKIVRPGSSPCSSEAKVKPDSLGEIFSPLKGVNERPSIPPPENSSVESLRVEVPLSPAHSDRPPPWERRNVSFSEALAEVIDELPEMIPASESNVEEEIDTIFDEAIAPIATKAERSIEQEQLQEADTIYRIIVPVMDLSRPRAPWEGSIHISGPEKNSQFVQDILSEPEALDLKKSFWRISGKMERELTWVPFPASLANVEMLEIDDDDGTPAHFVDRSECIDAETLVWKPDGLRIFDHVADSDEEELEEGMFPDGKDIDSLVRKRKLELLEETASNSRIANKHPRQNIGIEQVESQQTICDTDKVLDLDPFSALSSLNVLLGHRTGKTNIMSTRKENNNMDRQQLLKAQNAHQQELERKHRANPHQTPSHQSAPVPNILIPDDSRQFIISTSFLSNRTLARRLSSLYPTANIIERDLNTPMDANHSAIREADMIIAPSIGLICTNLQKIKQRALPGQEEQSNLSPVQRQIALASPRYEQLLVLVSQNAHAMDAVIEPIASDLEAVAELTAFCTNASPGVSVVCISGGEEQLATWIVALMIKHSIPGARSMLTQEESAGERLLSRAGLNAFAAQIVLFDLKQQGVGDLGAFLSMPLDHKVAQFGEVVGSRNCLTRVHEILHVRW